MIHIYKITNLVNGKAYIGQTCGLLKNRWQSHVSYAKRGVGSPALQGALAKYGEQNFSIYILAVCQSGTVADAMEAAMIRLFMTRNPQHGYNISFGGMGRSTRGIKWRPESRMKLSQSVKGNARRRGMTNSPEHREKTRRTLLGHPVSAETRAKIRASMLASPKCRGFSQAERNARKRAMNVAC